MMLCDEQGRGIIKDWHPNGHIRFFRDNKVTNNWVLQYKWQRSVMDVDKQETLTETVWRKVPQVEASDDIPTTD